MERLYSHRGIIFLIHRVGQGHWEWRLVPPKDVQGLWPENGTVYGEIGASKFFDWQLYVDVEDDEEHPDQ